MSSSVFFRFKSQKEPSRVTFDGTGISVFELKREIISVNRLGDGTDFELLISSEDTNEEYDDDTSIVPRSTTVIARRLPAAKPGRGGAARYVSGKMPQHAKNGHRTEPSTARPITKSKAPDPSSGLSEIDGAQTEDERIAAMFKVEADQWAQQQQEMANATRVSRPGAPKAKAPNMPDRPPPSGYVCYRCGEKGHWIQACPTNDDPNFDGRPRVKRTTGIPRSFLKTVERPNTTANDGNEDDVNQPSGVMVNADGDWVVAEPDKASWDQYQAKAKVSAAAQEAAAAGDKELQSRGLECPVDKRLFVEPTLTPCCSTTFCHDCINNALLENDLRCPHCATENILIDDLKVDTDMVAKIESFEKEGKAAAAQRRKSKSPSNEDEPERETTSTASQDERPRSRGLAKPSTPSSDTQATRQTKKRPADIELSNDRKKRSPSFTTAQKTAITNTENPASTTQIPKAPQSNAGNNQHNIPNSNSSFSGINPMMFPTTNPFMPMPMPMPMPMTMAPNMGGMPQMFDHMFMSNGAFNNMNPMFNPNFPQQPMSMGGQPFPHGMMPNMGFGQQNSPSAQNLMGTSNNGFAQGLGRGMPQFKNQQRNTNEEDSAYFRNPVNPHRHQGRRNMSRPADFRDI